ncbi:murein transglycosylase A [Thiovibrio frasassiensis]|uniref:peptidoglycan lytic exotransglycosylase n=1 Tax=Thiovibrio frasassiensis TaxID=2984131 RepID=A0A9X4RQ41_9BACT|nr:murein transglycosylase A [Thiovibrio frasassiensis]MDG4475882.1 murein transglycosylase A [Thiovibrio frasassiensis]
MAKTIGIVVGVLILGCGVMFAGIPPVAGQCAQAEATAPLVAELPWLQDDLGYESLGPAIDRSVHYLRQLPAEKTFLLCGEHYSVAWLIESLLSFKRIIAEKPSPQALTALLKKQFILCQAAGRGSDRKMLLTGYFEPLFKASLTKSARYRYPLYRRPPDLVTIPRGKGEEKKSGRMENGTLVPYPTRAEIEKGDLLAGQELVYLADPVDAFILHIQGSGRIELADGSQRRVQFAAKNGHAYRSIGRLLVEKGVMPRQEATLPRIVRYLKEHPEEQEAILHYNDSFVFFRWGDGPAVGPQGCLGEPLTPGRSVALDQKCFPPGSLAFLTTRKPRVNAAGEIVGWEPLSRFVVNQDSGSAITGPGRLDLFWGGGRYAEVAAGNMKHPGVLYFLVKKK